MTSARIMIVEDNSTVARDLRDCLESLEYRVASIVASGEESIERAGADRPDAVLMDIRLRDEMDGIEAAERIFSRFEIPVVFLSAYSDRELLDRAKRVGSFGYLVKPFEERELFATLEMALYKSKTEKEHKRLEARLLQARKMEGLRVMSESIAHNYNNMLQSMLGYMELTRGELSAESPSLEFIDKAIHTARQAAELNELMLVYVDRNEETMRAVNLSIQVENMSRLLRSVAPESISLSLRLAHESAIIAAEPVKLRQLVMSLFTNAIEAIGEEPGEIVLSTRVATVDSGDLERNYVCEDLPAGDYVILEIADTGVGMEDLQPQAFDPFFSTKRMGRGLGLAAVLGIVRKHYGATAIESKPGEGATLRVLFPVAEKPLALESL